MVKARRSHNPFKRFQEFMERILVDPFTRGRLEPAKLARKLEQAMEDNLFLEAGDRRLAPNEYDIYLSTADHQRFSPGQQTLIQDLQNRLISLARKQDYILNKKPVLRLHGDPGLRLGEIHIDANLTDTDFNPQPIYWTYDAASSPHSNYSLYAEGMVECPFAECRSAGLSNR